MIIGLTKRMLIMYVTLKNFLITMPPFIFDKLYSTYLVLTFLTEAIDAYKHHMSQTSNNKIAELARGEMYE